MSSGSGYQFEQPKNLGVVVCDHVWENDQPILYVSHDNEGEWQFLCGGVHDAGDTKPMLVSLESVVERDPSLNELADLAINHWAERKKASDPWLVTDQTEEDIVHAVVEHGFFVALFDENPPAVANNFGYTIGLFETLEHPDLFLMGQPLERMQKVLREMGARLRDGVRYHRDEKIHGLLENRACTLRPVDPSWFGDFLGYGLWYYGKPFDVFQIVWSDEQGLFPWQPGCDEATVLAQPDLSREKE